MALTANRDLNRYVDQELRSQPVAAGEHIWKGALVGIDRTTGDARNLTAGDMFAGIAYEEGDNTGGSGGAISVRLFTQGDFAMSVGNATADLVGAPVYALNNESVDVSPAAVGASYCGLLVAVTGSGKGIVRIRSMAGQQIEHVANVPLSSLISAATTNPVLIAQRRLRLLHAQVCFNTKPDQGNLDVGTDASDPDEIVDAFSLATLTNNTPATLTLVGNIVAKGQRVWAKAGQASSTPGVGGVLSIRYVELP
jgi:hypothetical protein